MDRRCRWILPVNPSTGVTPAIPVGGLPRTFEQLMAITGPEWVIIGAVLRLDIRPGDTIQTMRNGYGAWLGIGYNVWRDWYGY
jgi:hypothetical protein